MAKIQVCTIAVQVAEDVSREVEKRAAAVRANKNAIVKSFVRDEKQQRPSCCALENEASNYTVDPRFPGKVTTKQ